ncbi:MAG: transcriptional regulator [Propionibacteriales bacterium]|nr:transcriptional regulator [Propionibacteriales bacterium]
MVHIRPLETVESALRASDAGMRDADNAALHGVTIKTIRRWRRDYQRRGKRRGGLSNSVPCPRCDGAVLDEQAYSELFGWYLGDGTITVLRRGIFGLHVFNDSRYVVLNQHVLELMRRVKPGGSPSTRRTSCTIITSWWKHWPCLFPQHGPGYKHTRRLRMEDWQRDIVEAYPADFLRGLFHSDGCRVNNWATRTVAGEKKRYDYPRWQFTNMSPEIMRWCGEALDLLEIPWRRSNHKTLSVSTRAAVARLDELIGLKS